MEWWRGQVIGGAGCDDLIPFGTVGQQFHCQYSAQTALTVRVYGYCLEAGTAEVCDRYEVDLPFMFDDSIDVSGGKVLIWSYEADGEFSYVFFWATTDFSVLSTSGEVWDWEINIKHLPHYRVALSAFVCETDCCTADCDAFPSGTITGADLTFQNELGGRNWDVGEPVQVLEITVANCGGETTQVAGDSQVACPGWEAGDKPLG